MKGLKLDNKPKMVKQTTLSPEDALHSFTCPLRLEVACPEGGYV